MSNELEFRRVLRALDAPREPATDLWPGIAARLGPRTAPKRSRRWLPLALAASAVLAMAVASVAVIGPRAPAHLATTPDAPAAVDRTDPRLAAAGVVLDAAQAELEQALRQDPGSRLLTNLLDRTERQRRHLARWENAVPSTLETRT